MHIALITVCATGHVFASLPMAAALVARGVRVKCFSSENFREAVALTGADFYPVDTVLSKQSEPGKGPEDDMIAELPLRFLTEAEHLIGQILPVLQKDKPDAIIADSLALAGRLAASKMHLPLIMTFTSYAPNGHFSAARQFPVVPDTHPARVKARLLAEKFTKEYGVPPLDLYEIFEGTGDLNIVMLQRAFHPAGETYDKRFVFVGAQITRRVNTGTWEAPKDGLPVVYSSLGTLFNNWPDFYRILAEAARGPDIHVEAAIGDSIDPASLGELPDHMSVAPFLPQLDILEKASLFITHAGTGSVMEAIYFGVPMLCLPQMDEQALTAARVEELGLGLVLPGRGTLTPDILRAGIEKVLSDSSIQQNIKQMQADMLASGGAGAAADAILDFLQ